MLGLAACICFAIALVLHLVGGAQGGVVLDFLIGGALALAIHLLYDWRPWTR
jgi:hypothetical protein